MNIHATEMIQVGVDIGGTFTDLVFVKPSGDLDRMKLPTTTNDYSQAIVEGIVRFCEQHGFEHESVGEITHATTVATNAILERQGVRTALVTTEGFRDVLELRRIRIPLSYDLSWEKPAPLVERALRFTVQERINAAGEVLQPLGEDSLAHLVDQIGEANVDAVAVCLLHAYRSPRHEQMIGAVLRERFPDLYISLSHEVLPEILEFERTSTTVVNAYVAPLIGQYLSALRASLAARQIVAPIFVMQSNGGLVSAHTASERPVTIIESGPAAGVIAAAHIAKRIGCADVITLDMGGTTTKASIIENHEILRASEYEVGSAMSVSSRLVRGGGYLLRMPVVDVSEVGAGGGSIATVDVGGALRVGPRSAGSDPGPACYGNGNEAPTVTDANLVLGYLSPGSLAGGSLPISRELSERAIENAIVGPTGMNLMDAAYGIHLVANSNMVRAIKSVSVERGRDPAGYTMMAFGGAGPIHAALLAQSLGIRKVLIPPSPGVFSAFGLIGAEVEHHVARTVLVSTRNASIAGLQNTLEEMRGEILIRMRSEGINDSQTRFQAFADVRYSGQASELTIKFESFSDETHLRDMETRFEEEYEKTYRHRSPHKSFELVTLRLVGSADRPNRAQKNWSSTAKYAGERERLCYFGSEVGMLKTPLLERADLTTEMIEGPAIIQEYDSTVVVPPSCQVGIDENYNIVIAADDPRHTSFSIADVGLSKADLP